MAAIATGCAVVQHLSFTEPTVDLAAVSDEELEIAMEWDVLEDVDLEMMEELELLEAMLAMERRGQG